MKTAEFILILIDYKNNSFEDSKFIPTVLEKLRLDI